MFQHRGIRRVLLLCILTLCTSVAAQAGGKFEATPGLVVQPYPNPGIQVLDPSFKKYTLYSADIERLATGFRWAEGPVWIGDMRSLLWSDIPNNQILRWDEETGETTIFRKPANFSNGLARDRQGRLIACEHLRRVTRTEHDGSITIIADSFAGKKLNSPNDLAVKSDNSIWFTDPPFGINGHYEGYKQEREQEHQGVYRIDPVSGEVQLMWADIQGPNGIAFSPDESILYVVEGRAVPNRLILAFDVVENGTKLANKRTFIDAEGGMADGFKVDTDGNLWCGWGGSEELNGVAVFNSEGKKIGFIKTPERISNLVFGGEKRNRLFMTGCKSIYSLFVEAQGAAPSFDK